MIGGRPAIEADTRNLHVVPSVIIAPHSDLA